MDIGWNKYNIYFDVDSGYYPEINEDSVKDPNNRWEKTYAHESVVAAIAAVERILSRAGTGLRVHTEPGNRDFCGLYKIYWNVRLKI